jgi:hypothetical protein
MITAPETHFFKNNNKYLVCIKKIEQVSKEFFF